LVLDNVIAINTAPTLTLQTLTELNDGSATIAFFDRFESSACQVEVMAVKILSFPIRQEAT
jgi:hypothetical protein